MVIYEVRIEAERAIAPDYRAWLERHVAEILALPGFTQAEVLAEDSDGARAIWQVRYHLESRAALERYLRDDAPRLRAEGIARFGSAVSATRRVLALEARWSSP